MKAAPWRRRREAATQARSQAKSHSKHISSFQHLYGTVLQGMVLLSGNQCRKRKRLLLWRMTTRVSLVENVSTFWLERCCNAGCWRFCRTWEGHFFCLLPLLVTIWWVKHKIGVFNVMRFTAPHGSAFSLRLKAAHVVVLFLGGAPSYSMQRPNHHIPNKSKWWDNCSRIAAKAVFSFAIQQWHHETKIIFRIRLIAFFHNRLLPRILVWISGVKSSSVPTQVVGDASRIWWLSCAASPALSAVRVIAQLIVGRWLLAPAGFGPWGIIFCWKFGFNFRHGYLSIWCLSLIEIILAILVALIVYVGVAESHRTNRKSLAVFLFMAQFCSHIVDSIWLWLPNVIGKDCTTRFPLGRTV